MVNTEKVQNNEDSGLALLVCFGVIITFVAGIGHVNSFGLVYNDFMTETHSTANALTTAHAIFAIMLAFGGIILNSMTTLIPLHTGGLIGAAIFSIGSILTVLITNINQLPITFGILQGIGFGIMVPVAYSTFNSYFSKRRTTAMSICKAIQGIVLTFYPQLLKNLMSYYGFRGTLLLITGISLHTIPGMIAMNIEKQHSIADKKYSAEKHENIELINDMETRENDKFINEPEINKKSSKITSRIFQIVNLGVLKNPTYCNICIGQSFVNFSDLTFFILQPMLLFQYFYDQKQVAACISIAAGADVAGRFFLAILSSLITVNTRFLFYIATFLTFLMRLIMLQVNEFLWMALITGVLGILRAWLHISSPLVISHQVSHKDFPGAYAVLMLCTGAVNLLLGPFIGLIKDITKDYRIAFYALALCCLPCIILWPIEYIIIRRKSQVTVDINIS